jgi:hypothetical protein
MKPTEADRKAALQVLRLPCYGGLSMQDSVARHIATAMQPEREAVQKALKAAHAVGFRDGVMAERKGAGRLGETLRGVAEQLDKWATESLSGGWSTHQVEPMRKLSHHIRTLIEEGI